MVVNLFSWLYPKRRCPDKDIVVDFTGPLVCFFTRGTLVASVASDLCADHGVFAPVFTLHKVAAHEILQFRDKPCQGQKV